MGRRKQGLPNAVTKPEGARTRRAARGSRRRFRWSVGGAGVVLAATIPVALAMVGHASSSAAVDRRVDHEVGALLAGIPQAGGTLGRPTAPVTMEVFIDLEDPTCRWWFREDLPAIVEAYVRTGALKLSYRAFKRNTYWPAVFIKQQAAALAAGAQNRLWNFIYTLLYEQGKEGTNYVSESFLHGIAGQDPGLNLARWQRDRHTGRREERTAAEDQTAKALGLYVTPAFRIGKSGGPMRIFTGRLMVQYPEQHHPIALIEAADVANAIQLLAHNRSLPRTSPVRPETLTTRLE